MRLNLNRNRIWTSLHFGGNMLKVNWKHLVLVFLLVFLYFVVFSAIWISFRKSRCMLLSEALSPTLSHYRFYNFRVCSQKPKVQRIILTLPNKGCSFISSPRDGDLMEPAFSRSVFSPVFH